MLIDAQGLRTPECPLFTDLSLTSVPATDALVSTAAAR
jgi:hypothetical protein